MAAGATGWDIPQKAVWAVTRNDLGPTLALCPCFCIFPCLKLYFQLCNQRLIFVQQCGQLACSQVQCVLGEGKVDEAENTRSHIPQGEDHCRGKRAGSTQGVQFGVELGI